MELYQLIGACAGFLGLVGGLLSSFLTLRIKQGILENNEKIEKDIKDLQTELTKELHESFIMLEEKIEKNKKEITLVIDNLDDKILNVVNGKYVRTDLYQQSVINVQERFTSMKELIEVNMNKIEHGLDRQIIDLKERIFRSN